MSTMTPYMPLAWNSACSLSTELTEGGAYCLQLTDLVETHRDVLVRAFETGQELKEAVGSLRPVVDPKRVTRIGELANLLRGHFTDIPDTKGLIALVAMGSAQQTSNGIYRMRGIVPPTGGELTFLAGIYRYIGDALKTWAESSREAFKEPAPPRKVERPLPEGLSEDVFLVDFLQGEDEAGLIFFLSTKPWSVEKNLAVLASMPSAPAQGVLVGLALADEERPGPWAQGDVSSLVGGILHGGLLGALSRGTMARTLRWMGERADSVVDPLVEAKRRLSSRIRELDDASRLLDQPSAGRGHEAAARALMQSRERVSLLYRGLDTLYLEHLMNKVGREEDGRELVREMIEMDESLGSGAAVPRMDRDPVPASSEELKERDQRLMKALDSGVSQSNFGNYFQWAQFKRVLEEAAVSQNPELRDKLIAYCRGVLEGRFPNLSASDRIYFAALHFHVASDSDRDAALGYLEESLRTEDHEQDVLLIPIGKTLLKVSERRFEPLLRKILAQMMGSSEARIVLAAVELAFEAVFDHGMETIIGLPVHEALRSLLRPDWEQPKKHEEGYVDVGGRVAFGGFLENIKDLVSQPRQRIFTHGAAESLYRALEVNPPEPRSLFEIRRDAMLYLDHIDPDWRNLGTLRRNS